MLAGKSTLNRLELTPATATAKARYKKIAMPPMIRCTGTRKGAFSTATTVTIAICRCTSSVESSCWVCAYGRRTSMLRPEGETDSCGVAGGAHPWVRADSGFCCEELMAWCEAEGVDYLLGLAKNERMKAQIKKESQQARQQYQETGHAARIFKEFYYKTRKSWSQQRRVVAKAEHLEKGENPRFVVTSLRAEEWPASGLYEELYCGRGDMGVSSKGDINQSVKVRPRLTDSSLVAREALRREIKAAKPSDNLLRK